MDSTIDIKFMTYNQLPPQATIVVDVPPTIAQLYQDTSKCIIKLNGVVVQTRECAISDFKISIKNAFSSFTASNFIGKIQI